MLWAATQAGKARGEVVSGIGLLEQLRPFGGFGFGERSEQHLRNCPRKAVTGPGWGCDTTLSPSMGQKHPRSPSIDMAAPLDLLQPGEWFILVLMATRHLSYGAREWTVSGGLPAFARREASRERQESPVPVATLPRAWQPLP